MISNINEEVDVKWSASRNLDISHIPLDPRELGIESMTVCKSNRNDPGFYFDCDCLTKQSDFPSFVTVHNSSAVSTSRYQAYEVLFYDVQSLDDILKKEECFPIPNTYLSILVVNNITSDDEIELKLSVNFTQRKLERDVDIKPGEQKIACAQVEYV